MFSMATESEAMQSWGTATRVKFPSAFNIFLLRPLSKTPYISTLQYSSALLNVKLNVKLNRPYSVVLCS